MDHSVLISFIQLTIFVLIFSSLFVPSWLGFKIFHQISPDAHHSCWPGIFSRVCLFWYNLHSSLLDSGIFYHQLSQHALDGSGTQTDRLDLTLLLWTLCCSNHHFVTAISFIFFCHTFLLPYSTRHIDYLNMLGPVRVHDRHLHLTLRLWTLCCSNHRCVRAIPSIFFCHTFLFLFFTRHTDYLNMLGTVRAHKPIVWTSHHGCEGCAVRTNRLWESFFLYSFIIYFCSPPNLLAWKGLKELNVRFSNFSKNKNIGSK